MDVGTGSLVENRNSSCPEELQAIEERIGDLDKVTDELPDLDRAVEDELRTRDRNTEESWGDGYRDMLYTFAEAGLPAPPVPESLRPQLQRLEPWSWSTRPIDPMEMYMFDEYIEEAIAGETADYVAVSHGGHGINSYGINYHLVHGPLAIFAQDGWGGIFMDPVLSRVELATTFSWVYEFIEGVPEDVLSDPPNRVILAWSGFRGVCGAMQAQAGAEDEWVDVPDREALFDLGAHFAAKSARSLGVARQPE